MENCAEIKNIIFDLCGPIITIDLAMLNGKLREYGVGEEDPYRHLVRCGLTDQFEQRQITPREFCERVREELCCNLSDEQIFDSWNTLISRFPKSNCELLRKVHKNYRTYVLSNSDEVNAEYFSDYLREHGDMGFPEGAIDRIYYSCELGVRKPSPEAFIRLIEREGIRAEETLHIDDTRRHCEGAREAGLKSIYLDKGHELRELFDSEGWLKKLD